MVNIDPSSVRGERSGCMSSRYTILTIHVATTTTIPSQFLSAQKSKTSLFTKVFCVVRLPPTNEKRGANGNGNGVYTRYTVKDTCRNKINMSVRTR
jgi:hypothetical protein